MASPLASDSPISGTRKEQQRAAKILILSDQIPHSVSAGNIQLLRLFADYPSDHIVAVGPPVPAGAKTLACRYVGWEPPFTRLNHTRLVDGT